MLQRKKAAIDALVAMKEANEALNEILYSTSGIYGNAVAAKAYIESIYGFGSAKHKAVTKLQFRSSVAGSRSPVGIVLI